MKKNCFKLFIAACTAVIFFIGCNSESKNAAIASSNQVSPNSLSEVFEVIDFLPGEELPADATYPTIQVQFSEPVIALQELGAVSDKSPYISIEPEIKGSYRWFGSSLLSFVASEKVIPQMKYTVKVAPDIVSLSGKSLKGQTEFQFHTEELKISSLIPGFENFKAGKGIPYYSEYTRVSIPNAMDFGICFNAPVNPEIVKNYISIVNGEGKNYAFTVEAPNLDKEIENSKNIIRVKLTESPKEGEDLKIKLAQGARGDENYYETTEERVEILPIKEPFTYSSYDIDSDYYGCNNYLSIYFSNQLKDGQEEQILGLLSFNKDIKITKDNIGIDYHDIILHDLPVDYNETFELTINPGVEDCDGRKTTEATVLSITVPKARGSVSYKNYNSFAMLEAKYTPRLAFMHRNIASNASYTVTGITELNGKKSGKGQSTVKLSPGAENQYTLETVELSDKLGQTESGNFHGAVRFETVIPYKTYTRNWNTNKLEDKIYNSERDQIIQVTDLGLTVRYGYNQAVVLVTSLETGKPVANASVTAYAAEASTYDADEMSKMLQKNFKHRTLGTATTDSKGLAVIDFAPGTLSSLNYQNIFIEAKTNDDSAMFIPSGHNRWNSPVSDLESPEYGEEEKSYAFIFTDRGLYKPGETVTFRIIDRTLNKGKFKPYTGKCEIKLSDPWWWNATIYQTKADSTSNTGTIWGEFKIPEDMAPGEYCITYSHENDSEIRRCYIQIQYFEAAKFEVITEINKDKKYYSGDELSATVSARYLGGGNMGETSYDAYWTRSPVRFAMADEFSDMSFGPIDGYYDGQTSLDSSNGKLDGTGSVKIKQISGGEKIKGIPYSYTIQTSITDSGNQQISSKGSVTVHPAKFYLGLSDITNISGYPKKNTELKFNYVCITPDGEAPNSSLLPGNKKMTMELLHEEWEEVNQISWNGEVSTRYSKKLVSDKKETLNLSGSKKPTEISVTPEAGGAYVLRLTTQDSTGNEIITEQSFYVTGSDWYWFSRDNATEITLTTDKPEYNIGETAHILMQSHRRLSAAESAAAILEAYDGT